MSYLNNLILKLNYLFLIFLPAAVISGPFLTDLTISLSGLLFIYIFFKNINDFKSNYIIFLFFFSFCIYIILLSLFSKNILLSFESSLFYFRFGLLSMNIYFMIKNYKNFIFYFGIVFFITYCFVILDAFFQYINGFNLFGMLYSSDRLHGVFGEEGVLGSYLSRYLPIFIALILHLFKNKKLNSYIILSVLVLSAFLILLSGERTALIYYLLFFTLFIILIYDFIKIKYFSFFLICIVLFFTLMTDNAVKNRILVLTKYQLNISNDNDTDRLRVFSIQHEVIYLTAIKIIKDNYVFGIGPKMFRQICKQDKYQTKTLLDGSIDGCQTHPHNSYVQLLTETGFIGFLILLSIFIYFTLQLIKHFIYKYYYKKNYLGNVELLIILAIYINIWPLVPNGNFFNNWLSSFYYIPVGLLLGLKSIENIKKNTTN